MKLVLVISVLAVVIQGYEANPGLEGPIQFFFNKYCNIRDVTFTQRDKEFTAKEAEDGTKFWLCTRKNKDLGDSQEMKINRTDLLENSHFNVSWPVRFVIHGTVNDKYSYVNSNITEAYLKKGDFNVIVVDWGDLSESFNNQPNYIINDESIKYVGIVLAKFAKFLNRNAKVPFENMYLIGHRLGAHIAGYAGANVKPSQFRTIFALDPDGPDYQNNPEERFIDTNDAYYVESIHVNSYDGRRRFVSKPVGHASFYLNFGVLQPGCDYHSGCSNDRGYEYFAESITSDKPFYGHECHNYDEFWSEHCTSSNRFGIMGGEPAQEKQFGIFYVRMNKSSPYRLEPFIPSKVVNLRFYTNRWHGSVASLSNITVKDINPAYPTRIIICSGLPDSAEKCANIRDAYLQRGGLNVIVVDYQKIIDNGEIGKNFFSEDIALIVGRLLQKLHNDFHIAYDDIYMIGSDLGSKIANLAANTIFPNKINTLFALDYPERLIKTAARYIESIQGHKPPRNGNVNVFLLTPKWAEHCSPTDRKCIRPAADIFVQTIKYPHEILASKCDAHHHSCHDDIMEFGGEPSNANKGSYPNLYYRKFRN